MLVNLTSVLTSEGMTAQYDEVYTKDVFICQFGEFQIIQKSPVHLTVCNTGILAADLQGTFELTLQMQCDRCLEDVSQAMQLSFQRDIVIHEETEAEQGEELSFMEGYQLNIDELIYSEILINWPTKILCSDNCKGICNKCGQNLNHGQCGCDTFVPDPRMAAIKDIFNANKEV